MVELVWQGLVAVSMCVVGEVVGPFACHRLVEALGFAVAKPVAPATSRGPQPVWRRQSQIRSCSSAASSCGDDGVGSSGPATRPLADPHPASDATADARSPATP